uniref:Uncharacterized protein n=1 Tax=Arundo donax TaxID=35708 RepID=A0A0A9DG87_ARUDO
MVHPGFSKPPIGMTG